MCFLIFVMVFLISCDKDDQTGNQEPNNPSTESNDSL